MKSIARLKEQARQHEQREEWDRAIRAYEQALRTAEAEGGEVELSLFNRIGDLYLRLGKRREAVASYEEAADRYATVGLYNNAIALCNKALRQMPERVDLHRKLGRLSAEQGFLTDARRWFLSYAEREFEAGKLKEAFDALEEFASLSDDPEVRELLADQLAAHGRTADAVVQLGQAYALRSAAGQVEEANALKEKILELDPEADLDALARAATGSDGPGRARAQRRDDGAYALPTLELQSAAGAAGIGTDEPVERDETPAQETTTLLRADDPAAELPTLPLADEPASELPTLPLTDEPASELPMVSLADEPVQGASASLLPDASDSESPAAPHGDASHSEPTASLQIDEPLPELPMLAPADGPGLDPAAPASPEVSDPDLLALLPADEPVQASATSLLIDEPTSDPSTSLSVGEPDPDPAASLLSDAAASDPSASLLADEPESDLPLFFPPDESTPDPPASAPTDEPVEEDGATVQETTTSLLADQAVSDPPAPFLADESELDRPASFLADASDLSLPTSSPVDEPDLDLGASPLADEPDPDLPILDVDAGAAGQPGVLFDLPELPVEPYEFEPVEPLLELEGPGLPVKPESDSGISDDAALSPVGATPLAEARARVAVGDYTGAVGVIREIDHTGAPAAEVLDLLEEITARIPDDMGAHQLRVEYAARTGATDRLVEAYLALAESLAKAGRVDRAGFAFTRVLELDPGNERAREALARQERRTAADGGIGASGVGAAGTGAGGVGGLAPSRAPGLTGASGAGAAAGAEVDDGYVDLSNLIDTSDLYGGADPSSTAGGAPGSDFSALLAKFRSKVAEPVGGGDPTSHYDLGLAFKDMGLIDEAIAEFEAAYRGGIEGLKVYEELGQCFLLKGEYRAAEEILARALELPRKDERELIGVYYHLGRCYEELGQFDRARSAFERVYALGGDFRDVSRRLSGL